MPDISFEEIKSRLEINLSRRDYEKTQVLRLFFDLNNIRSLMQEEEIDPRGNLTEKELDEALLIRNILPSYVFDFLDQYATVEEKVKNFPALIERYYTEEIERQKGFLQTYLKFERDLRLVLTGYRAKKQKRDVMRELQFEDPQDSIVADILAQKDAATYDPPEEFRDLIELMRGCGPDPWEQHRVFAEYRFRKIGGMAELEIFSIDAILAYLAQLMIVEQWNEMDEVRGKMVLDTFKGG